MYQPNFDLTTKLLDNTAQIERFYGQLEGMRIPQKLELNLERDNLVQSSYISNSIEGNPLSLPEVTNLLLDDRVPVNRDELEVKNYYYLLQNLPQLISKNWSLKLIIDLHQQLLAGVEDQIAGQIRDTRVVIGHYIEKKQGVKLKVKHEPPFHSKRKIKQQLRLLLKWLEQSQVTPVLQSGIFHHQYVYLHPFIDGNGRTCRLLTALVFLKNDYLINKYFVLDDYYDLDREKYSDMLSSADQGDKTQWLEYFTDGVKYSLQSALSKLDAAMQQLSVEDRPTNREKDAIAFLQTYPEVTSSQLAEKLEVSRQQAHKLLSSLVEKGLVEKKGETKASYYRLK